jgi:hypothetical protein
MLKSALMTTMLAPAACASSRQSTSTSNQLPPSPSGTVTMHVF